MAKKVKIVTFSFNPAVLKYKPQEQSVVDYEIEQRKPRDFQCFSQFWGCVKANWLVASWASIDGYGRYKALHYEAKRFFEPIHISCVEIGKYTKRKDIHAERYFGYETKAQIFVNNDTLQDVEGSYRMEALFGGWSGIAEG